MTGMQLRRLMMFTVVTVVAVPLIAMSEPTPEELQRNRRYLEKMAQRDPDQLARLHRHTKTFLALPLERRDQLLKLHHDLHEETSSTQARLQNLMVRYAEWLNGLPETDRQKIKQATDKQARLQIIKAMREGEWLRYHPRAIQDQATALQGKERAALIVRVKQEERQRRQEWIMATRFWEELHNPAKKQQLPTRLAELPSEVQSYVNDYLLPWLAKEEKALLDKAQGKWPLYPQTLVELADRHPPALPGADGPRKIADLPPEIQRRLKLSPTDKNPIVKTKKGGVFKGLAQAEGKWPEFGAAVVEFARTVRQEILPHEYLAYSHQCLSKEVKDFIDKHLIPVLDSDEKLRLVNVSGKWPDYPLALHSMARSHHLEIPWQSLPGSPERWAKYRLKPMPTVQGLPELPEQKLRDFALIELSPKELEALKLADQNAKEWRQRLHEAYFKKHPHELKKLRQQDQVRWGKKGGDSFLIAPPKMNRPDF